MKTTQDQQKKGFTIIEVVLVLAIAGLIFLIVFLAVPALQRSQRDTQRRNDISRFMSQITQYQSNNQGNVPAGTTTAITTFKNNYMVVGGDEFKDPSKNAVYETIGHNSASATPSDELGDIDYYVNARCDASQPNSVNTGNGGRSVAALTALEGGGRFCQDNR